MRARRREYGSLGYRKRQKGSVGTRMGSIAEEGRDRETTSMGDAGAGRTTGECYRLGG